MSGVVSQRMNNPLANIECGVSELVQKMFAMYIIFADSDEITFANNGAISTVTKIDMLGRSIIQAKLKSQIKLQQQEQSRNALMVMQSLIGAQGVNRDNLVQTLVPIITQGVVSRKQAETFVEEPMLNPSQIQQLQQMLEQNAPEPPIVDQAAMENLAPEDVDQMMAASQTAITPGGMETTTVDQMTGAPMPVVDTGADNYLAGIEANNANPVGGLI